MAKLQSSILISLFLLQLAFPIITANLPPKDIEIVVEGTVHCQSCDTRGMWSLTGAKPIANAAISVICKDHRNRVMFYKPFKTNDDGYFYAALVGFKITNPLLDHPLQTCRVKLVSSPLEECSMLTNVNYGLNGAPLRYEEKRIVGEHYEAVIYAAGPLAFRPNECTPN
ncbi:hypothetical protein LIER_14224 [Lithospermum erythrorhizon]|uniref:Uncharacterized protein n=1 Tax=Lithospermum erythrorhizon TaxID=34254 RepID=A0AAV3Q0V5_LITER